jgi:hypothetical protein
MAIVGDCWRTRFKQGTTAMAFLLNRQNDSSLIGMSTIRSISFSWVVMAGQPFSCSQQCTSWFNNSSTTVLLGIFAQLTYSFVRIYLQFCSMRCLDYVQNNAHSRPFAYVARAKVMKHEQYFSILGINNVCA